jgi:hypothetical protein
MAEKLNQTVIAPTYVVKAMVKGQRYDQKVEVVQKRVGGQFTVILKNYMRTTIASMGKSALIKAINGRAAYFRRNLKSKVFEKVNTIAKKYPGIGVRGF